MKWKRALAGSIAVAGSLLLTSSNRLLPPLEQHPSPVEQPVAAEVMDEPEETPFPVLSDTHGAGGTVPTIGDTPGGGGGGPNSGVFSFPEVVEIPEETRPVVLPPDVRYCADNLALFEQLYPDEFAAAMEESKGPVRCLLGPAPAGATVLDVPYYNQCDFPDSDNNVCGSGCGNTSVKMVLEYMGFGEQDIDSLWGEMWTGESGTEPSRIAWALLSRNLLGDWVTEMSREEITTQIEAGSPTIIHSRPLNERAPYGDERFCAPNCPNSGHYLVITGVHDEGVLMHDPYTALPWETEFFENGSNMVVTWESLEAQLAGAVNNIFTIVPEEETLSKIGWREIPMERYTGEMTYCGNSRRLIGQEDLEDILSLHTVSVLDRAGACVSAPGLEDAIVWDTPFYPQTSFEPRVWLNGSGVVSSKMALEALGVSELVNANRHYDELNTTDYGTPFGGIMLSAFRQGVYGGVREDMPFEEIVEQVSQGRLIVMNTYTDQYAMEKFCMESCPDGVGHYLLIVGVDVSERAVIVHDPIAGSVAERGKYLVLSYDMLRDNIYPDGDRGTQLILVPPEE